MRTYSNNRRPSRGRDHDRRRDRSSDRGRDFGRSRPEMHSAICDECGRNCEVPFRPSGDKPIYCSSCFERHDDRSSNRGSSRDRSRRDFGRDSRRDFGRDSRRDKEMFDVVCDICGKDCQVPFKPSGDKPVLCSDCFAVKPGKSDERHNEINAKLDKILKVLDKIQNAKTWLVEPEKVTNDELRITKKKDDKKKKTEKILKKIAKKAPVKKVAKKEKKKTVKKSPAKKVIKKKTTKKVAKKT